MKNILGEEYKGDSKFVAKCRKLQSIYRYEIGEEIRPYTDRYGNLHYYGNYINDGETPKENCWKNFLTEDAFNYAKERVNPENKKLSNRTGYSIIYSPANRWHSICFAH